MKSKEEDEMTFWDHLEALRWMLMRCAVVLVALMIAVFLAKEWVFTAIFAPKSSSFFVYHWIDKLGALFYIHSLRIVPFNLNLVNFQLTGQFMTHLSVAFWLGLILSFPYFFYELWRFISPALYASERRPVVWTFMAGAILFFIGVSISYIIIFPVAVHFFYMYQISPDIKNLISLSSYISLFTTTLISIGAVFELPILVYLLSRLGILKRSFMRKYRRHAIVVIFIIAGIITPADPFTMLAVCLPLVLLYEASIYVCKK
ncbi:twin-arginine translocase subunit TatC [Microbacter margulisiae]|uniref:Sec-independent protein translocase protein TatC n=1 Tax=Microbacter margulisiae TaxID=1350067 RepID=A0A7W5H0A4_9PORP|nr:twin-arginine translocase subunit TatC [Microbacter margulisiae]MBB3186348.1 sec-independent protein translocase protein TatC [Microbacter margulisiae]